MKPDEVVKTCVPAWLALVCGLGACVFIGMVCYRTGAWIGARPVDDLKRQVTALQDAKRDLEGHLAERQAKKRELQGQLAERCGDEKRVRASSMPEHVFNAGRPGESRAQIRAVVMDAPKTEPEWRDLALRLARANPYAGGAYLVTFFDDAECLKGWPGSGGFREYDLAHWLCRVTIDTNRSGKIYARTFKVAPDAETGIERMDVMKK